MKQIYVYVKFNCLFNLELLEAHGLASKKGNILVELSNKETNYQTYDMIGLARSCW